ncbi:hypothetical protein E4U26_001588 [Claviceps purpurea]|nr:hypothetical protein E4U26_001588 [Claviceps purpurea]
MASCLNTTTSNPDQTCYRGLTEVTQTQGLLVDSDEHSEEEESHDVDGDGVNDKAATISFGTRFIQLGEREDEDHQFDRKGQKCCGHDERETLRGYAEVLNERDNDGENGEENI